MVKKPQPLGKGYVQVYTGTGKGKTTASIGLAVRAAGRGEKTYIAQFMKKGEYGEIFSINKYLKEHIVIEQFGLPEFHTQRDGVRPEEKEAAQRGLDAVKNALFSNRYRIVILDEINVTLYFKIVELSEVLDLIAQKPPGVEMVLTGRYAPQEILDRADLITEMKEVKHPFKKKIYARKGIGF